MHNSCKCLSKTNLFQATRLKVLIRTFVSQAATNEQLDVIHSKNYVICDKDPVSHTADDYNKIYTIGNQTIKSRLNEAVPKTFGNVSSAIQEHSMLIRKPALKIIEDLNRNDNILKKYLLYGTVGGGKSMSLLHVLHYCLLKDWVLLYVPNGYRFADSQGKTQVQRSQWKEDRVDQPTESIIWLNLFRSMNENFLLQNTTSATYKWGKREVTEKDEPLMAVVEQGVSRSLYANDAVGVLLKEIRMNKSTNVLYAVDCLNGFFDKTSHKLDGKRVNLNDLSLIHHFTKLLHSEHSLTRGAFVCALSKSVQYLGSDRHENSIEESLLNSPHVHDELTDFIPIEVGNYTENEYMTMVNFYKDKGWIARDLSASVLKEVRFMSNRNPFNVLKHCSFL